ncbi:uncharacterized protein LOC117168169 [Belonocnema kinseyi]|uniref:uncharacterized protein LOC117168169 n=1 Tax=Belonocnema kinseyi TaxID=2817044 RepID=UPI00143DD390|nr:uncharacterized protein LOC117168169 [Belonocnema kinseyi]
MEEVIENVKACLRSSKGGTPESRIEEDYRELIAEPIPFKKFNFPNLREFMEAIPGVRRTLRNNEYFYQVNSTEKTSHISKMVREQKPSKKPKRKGVTNNNMNRFAEKTPEDELRALAADLKLTLPKYKTVPARNGTIYAQVMVGREKYSSYPNGAKNQKAAQLIAVKIALDDLKEKNSSIMLPVTKDEKLLEERMLKILDSHPYGIFSSQFTIYYQQEFKESLPGNWMQIVNGCSEIIVETGVNNTSILMTRPKTPEVPEVFQWPDDPYVIMHVSEVLSTTEIWCKLVGNDHSEKRDKLQEKMKKFYTINSLSTKAKTIVPGVCYTICLGDKWVRVKCTEYEPSTQKATIFFIDNGKSNTCHAKLLHILDKQFYVLPAQAMRLSLYDLEDFEDYKEALVVAQAYLLDQHLCVNLQSCNSENGCKSVIFYDSQGPDLVNLNKAMSIEIIKSCMIDPQLKPERRITEVIVTHISQNGEVYVRLKNDDLKYLENRISLLAEKTLNQNLSKFIAKYVECMQLYLIKSPEDGKWYRVGIINLNKRTTEVDVCLLDSGKNMTIDVEELVDLEEVSPFLAYFPAQAIKIELHNVPYSTFDQQMVARLKEIAPEHQNFLVRVVRRPFNGSIPIVEMYKRKQPSNEIVSINNTLLFDAELRANDNNNNGEIKKLTKQYKRN